MQQDSQFLRRNLYSIYVFVLVSMKNPLFLNDLRSYQKKKKKNVVVYVGLLTH